MLPFACGAASTKNFKLAHFEMVINIGFLSDHRTHSLFPCYAQVSKEDAMNPPKVHGINLPGRDFLDEICFNLFHGNGTYRSHIDEKKRNVVEFIFFYSFLVSSTSCLLRVSFFR